jgi:NifU-like protein involved in Fe-S cluster formation
MTTMVQAATAQTFDLGDEALLAELAGLAGRLAREGHLDHPDASARASDTFTGSEIEVDVALEDGRIKDYAQRMTGCPIGRATASLVGRHVIGASADEVTEAAAQVDALLKGEPYAFAERWESLGLLEGARHLRQRHGAVRLVFRAVGQALATAEAAN